MANVMWMGFEEATTAIGEALSSLGNPDIIQHRRYHYPGFSEAINFTDATQVACVVRWDGIAEDRAAPAGIIVPSSMRYEVRLLTQTYGTDTEDGYTLAQKNIVKATANYFESLAYDRELNGLVLDVGLEASFVGDLIDTVSEEQFYGHQMNLRAVLWTN